MTRSIFAAIVLTTCVACALSAAPKLQQGGVHGVVVDEALTRDLQVMDSTAFALCMDNNLAIVVFNMSDGGNIDKIVSGERVGTLVQT